MIWTYLPYFAYFVMAVHALTTAGMAVVAIQNAQQLWALKSNT